MLRRLVGGSSRQGSKGASEQSHLLAKNDDAERARCPEMLAQRAQEWNDAYKKIGTAAAAKTGRPQVQEPVKQIPQPGRRLALLLTVIRSGLWTDDGEEDVWQVEVNGSASVATVKAQIESLYGVPATVQRLQPTGEPGGECWRDSVAAVVLAEQPFYLLPVFEVNAADHESDADPLEQDFQAYEAAMEEQSETIRALAQSLRGVKYKLVFLRPESAGGLAPGRSVHLTVDALAIVQDVKDKIEKELFGGVGLEDQPVVLTLNRAPLPLDAPMHFAGVSNGDTIIVASELQFGCPGCADGSFDAAMRHWAFAAD